MPPGAYLPPKPYPDPLQRFTAREAAVFFGRGPAIRALYDLVTSPTSRPVILYAGPTGVGKSSVLDAGLTPRLAASHRVVYVRRNPDFGLLGTLLHVLSPDPEHPAGDLSVAWREAEASGKPLAVILDQAEEVFTRPLAVAPSAGTVEDAASLRRGSVDPPREIASLVAAVRALFLDASQAPKGRLILGFRKEWLQDFECPHDDAGLGYERMLLGPLDRAGIIEAIEGPNRDPNLQRHYGLNVEPGLAREIATDLEADPDSALAPTLQVLLTKLWARAGGVGGTFTKKLYDQLYDEGILLQDLLDHGLEALKHWNLNVVESGLALDVLAYHTTDQVTAQTRSIAKMKVRYGHRSDVLDGLLACCVEQYLLIEADAGTDPAFPVPATRLGHDTLAPLVLSRFRNSYAPGQRARRLLENRAPEWVNPDGTVREGSVLNANHLETVDQGRLGMRDLDQSDEPRAAVISGLDGPERRLLVASREAEQRHRAEELERQRQIREANESAERARRDKEAETELRLKEQKDANGRQEEANRRLKRRAFSLLVALAATVVFAGLAVSYWRRADRQTEFAREQAHIAVSRRLAAESEMVRPSRLDLALLLALEAAKEADTRESRSSLERALDTRPEVIRFLHVPEGDVKSVAFGPEGQIVAGFIVSDHKAGVVHFDRNGNPLSPALFEISEGDITCLSLNSEGRTVAVGYDNQNNHTNTGAGVVLLSAEGEERDHYVLSDLEHWDRYLRCVAFGPKGEIVVGCGFWIGDQTEFGERRAEYGTVMQLKPDHDSKFDFETDGQVYHAAMGADSKIAVGVHDAFGDVAGVELFDSKGHPRPKTEEPSGAYKPSFVAFDPDGKVLLGLSGGVSRWSSEDSKIKQWLKVSEGEVTGIAFGPEGQIAVGYAASDGEPSGIVVLDPEGEGKRNRLLTSPIEVKELPEASGSLEILEGKSNPQGEIPSPAGKPLQINGVACTCWAFGPDGRIVAGHRTEGLMIFNAKGEPLRSAAIKVAEGEIYGVALGPNDRIAAGYMQFKDGDIGEDFRPKFRWISDSGVVLFDASGERLRFKPMTVSKSDIMGFSFRRNGQIALKTRSEGKEVVLFDADPASWRRKAGQVANRNLTPEEWARFFSEGP